MIFLLLQKLSWWISPMVADINRFFAFDTMTDFCQITTWVEQYLQLCWMTKTWTLCKSYSPAIYFLCESYKIIIVCTYQWDLTQHRLLAHRMFQFLGYCLICQDIHKSFVKINETNYHVFKCLVQSLQCIISFWLLIHFNLWPCLCDNIIGILETHYYATWPMDAFHH
jgi:hypothetical protein